MNKYEPILTKHTASTGYIQINQGKLFFQKFGQGKPIIVLHGGPGLSQDYLLPQMLELAKDHEVIFYDQRGSGQSLTTELNHDYINIDKFTEDLEQLRTELDLNNIILLGHSWGAFLAMSYAIKHPHSVSQMILLNPAPVNQKGQSDFIETVSKKLKPINKELSPLFNYHEFENLDHHTITKLYKKLFTVYFADAKHAGLLNLAMSKNAALSGFLVNELLEPEINEQLVHFIPRLKQLNIPTLIVHGNKDVIPRETAQEIHSAIKKSTIIYLNNCGHFPYLESPVELFAAIRKFLQ